MNLNKALFVGNLTANPEIIHTPKGTPVVNASLAVNEFYTPEDGERQQITTFIDIKVWVRPLKTSRSWPRRARRSSSRDLSVRMSGKIRKPARSAQSSMCAPTVGSLRNERALLQKLRHRLPNPNSNQKPRKASNHINGVGGALEHPHLLSQKPKIHGNRK